MFLMLHLDKELYHLDQCEYGPIHQEHQLPTWIGMGSILCILPFEVVLLLPLVVIRR